VKQLGGSDTQQMALIVQPYIEQKRMGHLSNERRVSKDPTVWHLESQATTSDEFQVSRFRADRSLATGAINLTASTFDEAELVIRRLASWASKLTERVHIEWIWGHHRVFVVQCDAEKRFRGSRPGSLSRTGSRLAPEIQVNRLTPILRARRKWPKTQAVRLFTECGLSAAAVYVLENTTAIKQLSQGKVTRQLQDDLRRLIVNPVLVRTDVSDRVNVSGLLLPRSGALSTVDEVLGFLMDKAKYVVSLGLSTKEFCFTLHQFISARAGAYGYAKPRVPRVHIDATWGGPDSLLYYPHDTYVVDTETEKISKRIRCKTHYLDMDSTGAWREVTAGEPWDWKQVLEQRELIDIARQTRLVADRLNKPVEVMFFVGVTASDGREISLPWFCTDKISSDFDRGISIRYAGRRVTICQFDDIDRVKHDWQAGTLTKPFSIRLRPAPADLRNEEFLVELARFSRLAGVPIELEGSVLAHCYYVLRRNGALVTTVDAFEEPRVARKYGKLVRDNIALRIETHGEKPRMMRVSRVQLLELLKAKAVEEALELFWEKDQGHLIEELVDLLEVIASAAELCDTSLKHLRAAALKKRRERGGFKEGMVLLETRSVPLLTRELTAHGLFGVGDELPKVRRSTSRIAQAFAASRMPKLDDEQIVVALVPPFSIDGRHESVVPLPDHSHEAVITYSECDVRIAFRERRRGHNDPRQLLLPFDDEGLPFMERSQKSTVLRVTGANGRKD
jgi:predicted house-cleaning noncanonical NTP pyrophosphatase (MazG superfamily)